MKITEKQKWRKSSAVLLLFGSVQNCAVAENTQKGNVCFETSFSRRICAKLVPYRFSSVFQPPIKSPEMNRQKSDLASYYSDFGQENPTDGPSKSNNDNNKSNNGEQSMGDVDPTFESFQRLSHSVNVRMPPQMMSHLFTLVQHDVFADDIYMTLKKMYDASKK